MDSGTPGTCVEIGYAPLVPYSRVPIVVVVGEVKKKAVVVDDQIVIRPMLPISATTYRKLNYHATRDLAPVAMVAISSHLLIVHPSLPVSTTKELIALAKTRPGQLNFASGGQGSGTHLAGELLKLLGGVDIVHIPYKGGADAATAVGSSAT